MCCGRHPGPLGDFCGGYGGVGPFWYVGPYCFHPFPREGPLTPGPVGSNSDPASTVADAVDTAKIAAEDLAELKLLVKVLGTVKNKAGSKSYVKRKKGDDEYRVTEYAGDRNAFFGSREKYKAFLKESRNELNANKETLRRQVEPPIKRRSKFTESEWKSAQDVFYAWVRKAYKNKLGESTDVPKLIKARTSKKLEAALEQVAADYGKTVEWGGFNPRPMKRNGYRLGTISEHALGNAIDISASKNAHIESGEWAHILKYTGKTLDKNARVTKWKSAPKDLYDKIKEISDEFKKKLSEAIKAKKDAATATNASPTATPEEKKKAAADLKNPLSAVIAEDKSLKGLGFQFVNKWKDGFFDLPWKLVFELHDEGFTWGATFSSPDLHHFEI